jgi:hypothetical protein
VTPRAADWPRSRSSILVALLAALVSSSPGKALTRIENDHGGSLGRYLLRFAALRDSGERVVIDGTCSSACTLVAALIPKERVCVTERAMLGFHAAWVAQGRRAAVVSPEGTQALYEMYPPQIQKWIARHGGLGPQMIVLKGRELARFYRPCGPDSGMASQ